MLLTLKWILLAKIVKSLYFLQKQEAISETSKTRMHRKGRGRFLFLLKKIYKEISVVSTESVVIECVTQIQIQKSIKGNNVYFS